ncbi:MAG: hypothetical protein ACK4HW_00575 [Roseinatronobacter sp.]
MSMKAIADFKARRAAVLAAHLKRDKEFLSHRRKRRIGFLLGTIKVSLGTIAALAVIKSAALATHGTTGYLQIVAPVLNSLAPDHLLAQAVAPDAYTQRLADTLAPYVRGQSAGLVHGPQPLPNTNVN